MADNEKPSTFFNILNFGLLPLGYIPGLFLLAYLFKQDFRSCGCKYTEELSKLIYPSSFDLNGKLELFFTLWAGLGLILFGFTVLVMLCRVIFRADPLNNRDPMIISAGNRAIQNTLEQSFIFMSVFGFWLLKYANESSLQLATGFAIAFFVTRVLYCFGYMIQGFTGLLVFRSTGYVLGVICYSLLILQFFKLDYVLAFTKYFDSANYLK